jgi:hypothetical protein
MGLLSKIKNVLTPGPAEKMDQQKYESEFNRIVDETWKEYAATRNYFYEVNLNETRTWTEIVKEWPDKKKVDFVLSLVPEIHTFNVGRRQWNYTEKAHQLDSVRTAYLRTIFRNKLIMDDEDARLIYEAFSTYRTRDYLGLTNWPIALMLNQLEKQYKKIGVSAELRLVLQAMKKGIADVQFNHGEKDRIKMQEKIDALLFDREAAGTDVKPVRLMGDDQFAEMANPVIEKMPKDERQSWYRLLQLAQKASGSKPSKKYLEASKAIIKELGTDRFRKTMHAWLSFLVGMKDRSEARSITYSEGYTYNYVDVEYLTAVNAEAVKGLVWACAQFHDNITIQSVAALAERTYRKIPGKGPTAASVGNACLYVLYLSKGLDGIGQLSRLKLRIKQNSTQAIIDRYLAAAASEQGVTIAEIEDMAVDDCGLVDGKREMQFDEYKGELTITGVGKTELKWYKPDGSLQKSVPAVVKEKQPVRLKKLKDIAKQVEQTLTAQRDRIDRMFRSGRLISSEAFERYYLQQGLTAFLANRLIWNFHFADGGVRPAIQLGGHWINESNEIVDVAGANGVSLWHPVQSTVAGIKAWRDFMVLHELQQPLKQAFREVYILTDAELNTRSYSNRMAAHILRQHQFNSLAKARGWRYALMGCFDNGMDNGTAQLILPEHNLRAEYWINEVNAENAMNDTGIWNYVSTDQVRFVNTAQDSVVDLVDVAPLVLSEVMRDVDLFVGVASVGNDPAWADSGGLPVYRNYWESYSFGELSEVAKNRKEILSGLVPRLKIRDVAAVDGKFLVVKGKLRTHKIHIGSTNILMEPNDEYLCIVPDRSQKSYTDNLYLPFEGDSALSVILSKAFLLAEDDKITDETITRQINRN